MSSQTEDRKLQVARITQLGFIIVFLFLTLVARLWYIQVACGEDLLKQSEANRIKLLRTRAPRGTILDCKGRILATSRQQFVVLAIPERLRENTEAMQTLCGILKMTPADLETIIKKDKSSRPGSPVRVAIDVPLDVVAQIGELRMKLPGVSVELDNIRNYPDGPAVAHIMGYLGEISQEELDDSEESGNDYKPGDYVGKAGLEKQYEQELRGKDGGKRIEVNAFGRVVRILGKEQPSIPGKTLKLSIDRDLQVAADRAMGKQVGAVVAINPQNGAVLAMVSSPQYDPNIFVKRVKASDWNQIINNRARPLQNRCVYNVYPPGSTFKPIVAIAGLVNNACNSHTTVFCPGCFYLGRARFGCWHRHGTVDFTKAIAQSCDVWFYNLGRRLGIDKIAAVAKQFGIGTATGIDLPGEGRKKDRKLGNMPDTEWKRKLYHTGWFPGETIICAIGQGYVLASPLQMALATAGVANSGKIYKPYLVSEMLDQNDCVIRHTRPQVVRQVNAPADDFKLVQSAMRQTIVSGTGRVCNVPGVTVCGKSGSAENRGAAHGWFVCFAPQDNPKIAIAAVVEHGRHGATSAAPVCRAIMDVYFGKKKVNQIQTRGVHVSGD